MQVQQPDHWINEWIGPSRSRLKLKWRSITLATLSTIEIEEADSMLMVVKSVSKPSGLDYQDYDLCKLELEDDGARNLN